MSADFIQVISKHLVEYARLMGYKGEVRVVPNAVDSKVFKNDYSEEELDLIREEIGKQAGDKFLVTTSRLVKKNGVTDVLRSLKFLDSNIKFLVIGDGPLEGELKEESRTHKVESRVLWLGKKNHQEISKYLAVSDIFIRPSLSEGLGNSFLEAMAVGLPVIATRVGGIPDFLQEPGSNDGKKATGLYCGVEDARSIAASVRRLLDDEALKDELVSNSKEMIAERFDWGDIAKKMKQIFHKLNKDQDE